MINPENYSISSQQDKLDIDFIHKNLSGSYWAKGITRSLVVKAIENGSVQKSVSFQ
ncbi:MAG: hypothetical protein ACSHW0_19105 [Thalassotalea sp.]